MITMSSRRTWAVAVFTLTVFPGSFALADQADADARWGVPPGFNIQTAPIKPAWAKRLTGYIKARDGIELRYSVLLPRGRGPFPVVLNYSGYDPGAIGGYAYLRNDTAMSANLDRSLLERGYAVLGVNARGTGCSEGVFDFLGPSYGQDGHDIVEWAAVQPWSTGSVGMANWSWAGMSQIATASERPPHLKAIAPGMALTDPRRDSWAIGGVPSQGFVTGWWMFLHSRWLAARESARAENDQRCLAQLERNYRNGETQAVNLPTQLIEHPLRDEWIDRRTILDHADRIAVPVLSLEAFQDEATTARAGYYQERLDPRRLWYVQTNGNHDLYESLQFRPMLLDFFDHFLKGLDNGFEHRPHVQVWQETHTRPGATGHEHDEQAQSGWIVTGNTYPMPVTLRELYFAPDHALVFDRKVPGPGATVADEFDYPVEGPTVDADRDQQSFGPMAPDWRAGSLAYTSEALPRDMVIYGPLSADLWVSLTASDADLQVTLTEVRDGQERFVQRGWLRLSSRALDPLLSMPARPWLCDRPSCIRAMTPGVPDLARVELTKVSYVFHKGARMRLWIDAPSATGGNSFDHATLPARVSIWHDEAHPSRLVFGELPDVVVPARSGTCPAMLMQPCRADPLAAP